MNGRNYLSVGDLLHKLRRSNLLDHTFGLLVGEQGLLVHRTRWLSLDLYLVGVVVLLLFLLHLLVLWLVDTGHRVGLRVGNHLHVVGVGFGIRVSPGPCIDPALPLGPSGLGMLLRLIHWRNLKFEL